MTENKYTYIYYELRNMLVLYIDDGYALSWLVDFVNRNNNIKHIDTLPLNLYPSTMVRPVINMKDANAPYLKITKYTKQTANITSAQSGSATANIPTMQATPFPPLNL